jgi:hypothetical protein
MKDKFMPHIVTCCGGYSPRKYEGDDLWDYKRQISESTDCGRDILDRLEVKWQIIGQLARISVDFGHPRG